MHDSFQIGSRLVLGIHVDRGSLLMMMNFVKPICGW